jgi:anti-anti-sigma factor
MDFVIERVGDVAVLELPMEDLDASNADEFKRDVAPFLEQDAKLVFDLTRLRFIDSSGLGAFLSCFRKVTTRGGDLKLCTPSFAVLAVLQLVRMDRIFDIHPTREAALRAFAAGKATGTTGTAA